MRNLLLLLLVPALALAQAETGGGASITGTAADPASVSASGSAPQFNCTVTTVCAWEGATTDANTTTTAPALRIKNTQAISNGDVLLAILNSSNEGALFTSASGGGWWLRSTSGAGHFQVDGSTGLSIRYGNAGFETGTLTMDSTGSRTGGSGFTAINSTASKGTAAPTGTDCDAAGEAGRIYFDNTAQVSYWCTGAAGWRPMGQSWHTAFDIDFTTQSNQTLGTDTTFTVGGKVFTKINSANESTAMAVTNGTGLVITPSGGGASDYYGSRTLPALTIGLSGVISGYTARTPVRVTAWVSGNFSADYDAFRMAFETASANRTSYILHRGFNSSSGMGALLVTDGSTRSESYRGGVAPYNLSPIVVALDMPAGIAGSYATVQGGASEATLVPAAVINVGTPTGVAPSTSGLSDWNLLFGAMRVNSGTSLAVTITRIKLEYYQ